MSDRELLELAAKAEGTVIWKTAFGNGGWSQPDGWSLWNPLENDGDALRLAVKLDIAFMQYTEKTSATTSKGQQFCEWLKDDPYAATRRAIVRAAAALSSTSHGQGSASEPAQGEKL